MIIMELSWFGLGTKTAVWLKIVPYRYLTFVIMVTVINTWLFCGTVLDNMPKVSHWN